MAYHTDADRLRTVQIKETVQENSKVKTLVFHDEGCQKAIPGQFVMVWIPGLDEIPMSISFTYSADNSAISVENVGQATEALQRMKVGDAIGVRGPFGNGFSMIEKGNALIVGGGTGLIPLTFLGEKLTKFRVKTTFLAGAKTRDDLLFQNRIESSVRKAHGKMVATTDDGSCGLKCLVTEPVEELLEKEKFDMIYTCGPEQMMHQMLLLADRHNLPLQASLERLMHCAIGICGSCVIGSLRVCMDGPVFTKEQLQSVRNEFGRFKLGVDGKRVKI